MLKYLTHKLRTQSINDENHVNEKIDGHDSGTESDGDLDQEDDLIQEHEMELSLSSRQDTVSPTDTACSSESPAFLGPSSSHLLLYDQNSSEEELEVINGSAGDVGSCAIEVGSVSGVPSRLSGGTIAGILPIMAAHVDDDEEDEEEEEEEEEDDDATEDIVDEDEEDGDYASPATATTPTAMGTTAATIIESTTGAMDTSSSTTGSSNNSGNSIVRGQFMVIGNACDDSGTEPLDDFAEELSSLTANPNVSLTPSSVTKHQISTGAGKRMGSVSSLLENRKRSLAHNSDDEVRYLLEQQQPQSIQQQQQKQQQQQTHHHPLSHQYHHHQHHHHHSMRQQHHHQEQQLHHQDELLQPEETPLSAPVNFRTSPPLEALKPHRGHILQRSTTPLVLSEGTGAGPTGTNGLLPTTGSSLLSSAASSLSSLSGTGISGFYGTGSNSNGVHGGSAGGLRFGLVRRPIGCDSPLTAVCHRNSTNPPPPHGGGTSSLGSGLSTTTRTSSSSTPSSLSSAPASLVRLGAGTGSPEPGGGSNTTLVTNMDISRSVSPPAKMFHCAVSPRRRQSRHQQQRLQRPHRPCLDFDKMQQLKARSVTTWRHSNEHSGELSVFCW
ncbi:lateral signaling target protein 2 homolog isoform X1 [Anopheles funestus]|uniref:lateral signaling target protein 2 homolog isoform X1 n=1 Tax=Anopheles funestus TaxID=62324 RepID=UPI0020C69FA3|nr:lateral signaling target protein 2 homolog isoform X1 [Anopheles funestus]XP_049283614.1 lateral signaling target protein 2 homolog isoform X1 [Anopheles funestus]XP_049283615.1 lateral signaling target protein 2 homolog isoform X1 [Anopheles funestus]XP_049283616.1 lateral signaling target protein 2 homolog isoform X1 [Anopheles funestus]